MSELILAAVLASTPITLEQVRELSRQNTPERLQELQYLIATEQGRTAASSIYPQLTVSGDANRTISGTQRAFVVIPFINSDGTTGFVNALGDQRGFNRNNFSVAASLSQLLFDGGKWWNQIAQAGALEEAAIGQTREQRSTSEYEGVRRFYALYLAQRTLDVLKATVIRSGEQVDRASALFEAGRSPKSDVIAAEVNLGNENGTREAPAVEGARATAARLGSRRGRGPRRVLADVGCPGQLHSPGARFRDRVFRSDASEHDQLWASSQLEHLLRVRNLGHGEDGALQPLNRGAELAAGHLRGGGRCPALSASSGSSS